MEAIFLEFGLFITFILELSSFMAIYSYKYAHFKLKSITFTFTVYSKNLVVRHFEKKNLGGIQQTPLRYSIHTGHVF